MHIEVCPIVVVKRLLYVVLVLLCANIAGVILQYHFNHDHVYGLIQLFDFNQERNIPSLYSSLLLFAASALLWFIFSTQRERGLPCISWLGLAVIFLFLSIDELTEIHERFGKPVREALNTSGLLFYAWVIPYGVGLAAFVAAYFPFLTKLPRNIMALFIMSGSIYVVGAIGFEMVGGRHDELFGDRNLIFALYYTCEELFEMLGIVVFIYSLLTFIANHSKSLVISVTSRC